jgi:NAD(P)-dependent dehydrogenase (short-subunit alcohol dehydrogenase family)
VNAAPAERVALRALKARGGTGDRVDRGHRRRRRGRPPSSDRIVAQRGRLDAVICTPAINVRKPILKYTGDEFDRVVTGEPDAAQLHVLHAAGRIMTSSNPGASCCSRRFDRSSPSHGQSVYSMSKAGIVHWSKTAPRNGRWTVCA